MRFRDYYRTKLPRWIQWSAPALLVLGIVGVAVGSWAIGSTDWWDPNSFRINVASALATACIGVPFAIVGLAYITESREIRSSLTEIASLTEQAWDRFKRTALSVTTPAVTSYLITDAQAVDKSVANIRIRLTHYQTLAGVPKGASPYDDVIKHPEQIDETKIRDEIAEMIRELQIRSTKYAEPSTTVRLSAATGRNYACGGRTFWMRSDAAGSR
ncbi:hypothetical protein GS532_18825 [Rhodococcus hoagii]|nr:hypothetical protein [Prescottella equi]